MGGNVGINTVSPVGPLHVKTKDQTVNGGLVIEDDNTTEKCWLFVSGSNEACLGQGAQCLRPGTVSIRCARSVNETKGSGAYFNT